MAAVRSYGLTGRVLRALPVVLLVGLVGLAVPLALRVSDRHSHDSGRDAVLVAARAEVTNLMNINAKTASRDLGRVIAGSTGDLRHQFELQRAHASSLAQTQAVLTGSVVSTGLLWLNESRDTARTVVAAAGTDSTAGSGSTLRHYRWVLTLRHIGDRWLVSDAALEGVPS
jgi:Mce-associated membrane protein